MNRDELLEKYIKIRREHDKLEERIRSSRKAKADLMKEYNKTEDHLKAVQSVGMLIGEIVNA